MDVPKAWSEAKFETTKAIAPSLQDIGIYVFLIVFVSHHYVSNAAVLLSHYDLGWHLAAGDLIRDRGGIPFQDPWAFTLGDKQWLNLSWLWDVIASVIFQYANFAGLVLFTVACGAIGVGWLASACLGSGASVVAAGLSVFSAALLYPSFATPPNTYLAVSPNTATMVFCIIFYAECLKTTRLLLLPVLMVAWANLHGGFPIGFFVIGIFGAAALLRRDWANLRNYAVAGAGCFIATFINPLGWQIYDGVAGTLGHFAQANIGEWKSYYWNMTLPGSIPGIIYILVFAALELTSRQFRSIPPESRLLSWLFLILGIYQFRYMSFFFIFSAVPLALHIDRLLPKQLNHFQIQKALLAAGIVGACALPLTFMRVEPVLRLPDMLTEQDARYLQTRFSGARVLNNWNVGGYLIFRTKGSVPLFVDGRAATAYPDELLRDYFSLIQWDIDETVWNAILDKYNIDTVLWVKEHEQLRRFLVDKKGWKEDYAGLNESIYVKP